MRAFFEEYGFIILSAIVIIALIAISNTLKGDVQANILDIMKAFKMYLVDNQKLIVKLEDMKDGFRSK